MSWRWPGNMCTVYGPGPRSARSPYVSVLIFRDREPRTGGAPAPAWGWAARPRCGGPRGARAPRPRPPSRAALSSLSVVLRSRSACGSRRVYRIRSRAARPALIHAHRLIDRLTGSTSLTACAARAPRSGRSWSRCRSSPRPRESERVTADALRSGASHCMCVHVLYVLTADCRAHGPCARCRWVPSGARGASPARCGAGRGRRGRPESMKRACEQAVGGAERRLFEFRDSTSKSTAHTSTCLHVHIHLDPSPPSAHPHLQRLYYRLISHKGVRWSTSGARIPHNIYSPTVWGKGRGLISCAAYLTCVADHPSTTTR